METEKMTKALADAHREIARLKKRETHLLETIVDIQVPRDAEIARLRGLIDCAIAAHSTCPWCGFSGRRHATDCPAFSAPGVVRTSEPKPAHGGETN